MSRFLIKLTDDKTNIDYYLEWSTVVDAPVTYGMDLKGLNEYIKDTYGTNGLEFLPDKLERIEKHGCSSYSDSIDELLKNNRAGFEENNLTKDEIIKIFCLDNSQ